MLTAEHLDDEQVLNHYAYAADMYHTLLKTKAPPIRCKKDYHLFDLPNELIEQIVRWVAPANDIFRNLSLVCHRFNKVIKSIPLYLSCDFYFSLRLDNPPDCSKKVCWVNSVGLPEIELKAIQNRSPERMLVIDDTTGNDIGSSSSSGFQRQRQNQHQQYHQEEQQYELFLGSCDVEVVVEAVVAQDAVEFAAYIRQVVLMSVFSYKRPRNKVVVLFELWDSRDWVFEKSEIVPVMRLFNELRPQDVRISWDPEMISLMNGHNITLTIRENSEIKLDNLQYLSEFSERFKELHIEKFQSPVYLSGLEEMSSLQEVSFPSKAVYRASAQLIAMDCSRLTNLSRIYLQEDATFEEFLRIAENFPSLRAFEEIHCINDPTEWLNRSIPQQCHLGRFTSLAFRMQQLDTMSLNFLVDVIVKLFPNLVNLYIHVKISERENFALLHKDHLYKILVRFDRFALKLKVLEFVVDRDGNGGDDMDHDGDDEDDEDDEEENLMVSKLEEQYVEVFDRIVEDGMALKVGCRGNVFWPL
ncbi:hypothetical protein HDU76_000810 [Blyttiomyces sp. JEL0837]|nr:hypothetical protein HDU76_000810 [Blyttiomyces sp. JEL0837]